MPETRSSLLDRVRDSNDKDGWVEFDRLYRPLLTAYARARGLRDSEAEEIAQQCMTAVALVMHKFKRDSSFRGWLRGMVSRKVADFIAERSRYTRADTALLMTTPGSDPPPEKVWQRIWNRAHIVYCIEGLRGEFASHTLNAFALYILDDEPVEVICERLGMTPNQVYVAKSRVTKRLREQSDAILSSLYGASP